MKNVVCQFLEAVSRCLVLLAILMLSPPASAMQEMVLTTGQLCEDADFVRRTLLENHPEPDFSVTPAALAKSLRDLHGRFGQALTQDQAWRQFALLNPVLADAHLFVGYADWRADTRAWLAGGGTLFPYEVAFRDDSLLISAQLGGADSPLKGATIVAIDGVPIARVTAELLDRVHGDTPRFRRALLAQRWWFYYWKMYGAVRTVELTLMRGAGATSIASAGSNAMPLLLRVEEQFDRQFRFSIQPDGSALLTIASFAPQEPAQFLAFTRSAFALLLQSDVPLLVIDISANGGGDDANWIDGLMPYLATRAYRTGSDYRKRITRENAGPGEVPGQVVTDAISKWRAPAADAAARFKGRIEVRIGPATYSSAVLFANVMRDFGFATLVGSGGAARRSQSGGVRQFVLPHSKLVLSVPAFVLDPPAGAAPGALLEADAMQ